MNNAQNTYQEHISSVQINGVLVRLSFAPEGNHEAAAVVKDILKNAYLRTQNAQ